MELSGKKVVVIGGTSGIGRAVAARCGALGADLVVASSSQARVDAARHDLPTGTVYPALRRLERAGLLTGAWSTVGGRERRTYTLSRAGRHALALQRAEWTAFRGVVDSVLGLAT